MGPADFFKSFAVDILIQLETVVRGHGDVGPTVVVEVAGGDASAKKEWIEKIVEGLKGRPFEDLKWQLAEDVVMDPFCRPEDWMQHPYALADGQKTNNSWEIGEDILVENDIAANKQVHHLLTRGFHGIDV